jgi:pimeloyl-ACP methyl ester carboxylesterase
MRLPAVIVAVLAASCSSVSPTPLTLEPCHIDGLKEEVRCGTHDVFEDRAGKVGRRLSIKFAVLPALRRIVQPDPLFVLAGGPGQGAQGMAPVAARYFKAIRRHRDIVLVDLRGTGASHALTCRSKDDEIALLSRTDFADQGRLCVQELGADPRFYTHRESLADLDEIRRLLGYERINLWGGSWGTRAALLYALRYPAAVRTITLDGAVPLTLEFPRTASATAQQALDRLIEACATDDTCRSAFPDPAADLDAMSRRFTDAAPITVTVPHPRTNAPTTATLTRGLVFDILRGALYVPRDAVAVMVLVRAAAEGNFAPLMAQYVRTASFTTDDMAFGATFSVLCSEDVPHVAGVDFQRDAHGSRFGTTYADGWRARCADWPAGAGLDEAPDAASRAPALILSGTRDPVTPPATGELMRRHFPRNLHVVVPAAAHNASFTGCVPELIATFIDRGTGDGLDAACAATPAWPPFVVSTAGSRP